MPGVRNILLTLVLVIAGSLAYLAYSPFSSGVPELQAGRALETPRPLAEFELIDHEGAAFGLDRLEGHWSLVFIGFTHCPDVCPGTLHLLGQLDQALRARDRDLNVIFVSVDPDRDTPETLAEYVGYFGGHITAVTGAHEQLARLNDRLDFAYVKIPGSEGHYTVDHSGALALVDPRVRLVGYLFPPFDLDELTVDLARVIGRR